MPGSFAALADAEGEGEGDADFLGEALGVGVAEALGGLGLRCRDAPRRLGHLRVERLVGGLRGLVVRVALQLRADEVGQAVLAGRRARALGRRRAGGGRAEAEADAEADAEAEALGSVVIPVFAASAAAWVWKQVSSASPATTHTLATCDATSNPFRAVVGVCASAEQPYVAPLASAMHCEVRRALLDRAVGQPRDLDLDRRARQGDIGLPDAEGVHPVADVLQGRVHRVGVGALGRGQDHRHAALEVQAEHRAQAVGARTRRSTAT